ncbi:MULTISPECIES: 50S ribosomal protein L11 methyltransferase [unclassified Clostridium]|jgi:ribosomal protein L11 methyltransferase (prmA)|uniref:50S ribosomal protein L11 methyltransferase n=1 Tax=unclassified Clostridium TaxID=2614128 RepID=UPI0025C5FD93|nr:50S ribosomal protein L11 methyltransferase [Clostridium sp.]MCI6693384.1 50S ribosomal protein L11 methyltransferase [Clostridium sp.]MDY2632736.1 50S ribosomal protein L11 methyltransferase [Clostridium sp.]MDY4253493.1 50S ribosomal protein L11 methyltransferase [Clostridium sp.]MDY6228138.1 50S ribosomal protein L11 methyltransferase [Clostridium sp.]
MYILTYNVKFSDLDNIIELLQINDIFNVFYESPLEITTDEYGYGYLEKEVDTIDIKIAYDEQFENLNLFKDKISSLLNSQCISLEEINYNYDTYDFPTININENWVLASPDEDICDKNINKISFISQGAFGTGLHETTKDLLNIILTKIDLHNKKVLDIGTGSGILSIASAIIGASKVTALDIRDVRDEVELNSSLNGVYNIQTLVGDALNGEVKIEDKFDWIYINIGGEETELFMDFIKEHLLPDGKLLVSGLVEWSFDKVQAIIENHGFKLTDKYQSNEWITAIFN